MNLSGWRLILVLTGATAGCIAGDRPLAMDRGQSKLEVAVHASMDSFIGQLERFDSAVTVADDGRVTAARVAFHFRDLHTGKEKRDVAMHAWQHTDEFPDGSFVLTSLEPATSPEGGFVAVGRLTLHGVVRDVRFPVSVLREAERYVIDGEAALDTRDFGLPVIRMRAVLKVDPVVKVRFHLVGKVES
jgi:polyisoprenoid-binding protein YceI